MQPMAEGIDIDPQVLNQTLLNKLSQSVIREAQMEAAIQQLLAEKQALQEQVIALEGVQDEVVEG